MFSSWSPSLSIIMQVAWKHRNTCISLIFTDDRRRNTFLYRIYTIKIYGLPQPDHHTYLHQLWSTLITPPLRWEPTVHTFSPRSRIVYVYQMWELHSRVILGVGRRVHDSEYTSLSTLNYQLFALSLRILIHSLFVCIPVSPLLSSLTLLQAYVSLQVDYFYRLLPLASYHRAMRQLEDREDGRKRPHRRVCAGVRRRTLRGL